MMKNFIKVSCVIALFGVSTPLITACDNNEGAFEELGENIDESAEEAGDEVEDATDQ